ncbi:MAG TPA: molecular chaperone [Caldimonas sp.]
MQALKFSTTDEHEELARAEVYGLLAHLFYAAPADELYAQLRLAVTEAPVQGAFLERGWSEVVAAARRLSVAEVSDEYAALFLGVGKPEVFLYGSFFLTGTLNGKPLVELRRDLRALGLERPETISETEDHLASLSEVMRYLIAGDDLGVSNLGAQQRFYNAHLRGWVEAFCDALAAHPRADFYRAVAGFARDFFAVEAQGLDLLDS